MAKCTPEQCVHHMLAEYRKPDAEFDFISALETQTGMDFLDEKFKPESLCYAHSPEVRDAYKTSFSTADLWTYVAHHASPQNADINAHLKTIFPQSKQQFWQTIKYDQ